MPIATELTAELAAEFELAGTYSLEATLGILGRGRGDSTLMVTPAGHWLAFNTADGPATLLLRQRGSESVVQAFSWGPGAGWAMDSVPGLIGMQDDWAAFDAEEFTATLPRLVREARRRHRGLRLPRTGRLVDALIPAILEQKVTNIEARRAYAYLLSHFGQAAPGMGDSSPVPAGLRVAPTPHGWARIPSWHWHKAGVGPQRSATVMRILQHSSALERLSALEAESAAQKLQSVPGVGQWTAAEVTQRTHGDADAVAVGDYHLASFVGWALLGEPVDDARMLELLEPWRGHRQRVVRMLSSSGFSKPTFGPRMTIADHRSH